MRSSCVMFVAAVCILFLVKFHLLLKNEKVNEKEYRQGKNEKVNEKEYRQGTK